MVLGSHWGFEIYAFFSLFVFFLVCGSTQNHGCISQGVCSYCFFQLEPGKKWLPIIFLFYKDKYWDSLLEVEKQEKIRS